MLKCYKFCCCETQISEIIQKCIPFQEKIQLILLSAANILSNAANIILCIVAGSKGFVMWAKPNWWNRFEVFAPFERKNRKYQQYH